MGKCCSKCCSNCCSKCSSKCCSKCCSKCKKKEDEKSEISIDDLTIMKHRQEILQITSFDPTASSPGEAAIDGTAKPAVSFHVKAPPGPTTSKSQRRESPADAISKLTVKSEEHVGAVKSAKSFNTTHSKPDSDAKFKYRLKLPATRNIIVGQDLFKPMKHIMEKHKVLYVPTVMHEPLSMLQRLAEYMEYCELIEKAAEMDSPVARMEYVCAFAVSTQSGGYQRMKVPFVPFLCETYEYVRPDMGFRFVAEKVSNNPTVIAFHAEGRKFILWGHMKPHTTFTFNTIENRPTGSLHMYLKRCRETYTWSYVDSTIKNIFMGKVWLEIHGTQEVHCSDSKIKGILSFKPRSQNYVDGFVYDDNVAKRAVYGNWAKGVYSSPVDEYQTFMADKLRKLAYSRRKRSYKKPLEAPSMEELDELYLDDIQDNKIEGLEKKKSDATAVSYNFHLQKQKTLWTANPRPSYLKQYYRMTSFAVTLNELNNEHHSILPPTDSRFREDIRLLENGDIVGASDTRNVLNSIHQEQVEGIAPRWFGSSGTEDNESWKFTGKYWDRNWDKYWRGKRRSRIASTMISAITENDETAM